MNNNTLRSNFESWAEQHLGQGYPLTVEDGTYMHPVTRWAFVAYKAAHNAQQAEIDRLMLEFCPDEMTAEQLGTWHLDEASEEG